jgi:hypothetical protein
MKEKALKAARKLTYCLKRAYECEEGISGNIDEAYLYAMDLILDILEQPDNKPCTKNALNSLLCGRCGLQVPHKEAYTFFLADSNIWVCKECYEKVTALCQDKK